MLTAWDIETNKFDNRIATDADSLEFETVLLISKLEHIIHNGEEPEEGSPEAAALENEISALFRQFDIVNTVVHQMDMIK